MKNQIAKYWSDHNGNIYDNTDGQIISTIYNGFTSDSDNAFPITNIMYNIMIDEIRKVVRPYRVKMYSYDQTIILTVVTTEDVIDIKLMKDRIELDIDSQSKFGLKIPYENYQKLFEYIK